MHLKAGVDCSNGMAGMFIKLLGTRQVVYINENRTDVPQPPA